MFLNNVEYDDKFNKLLKLWCSFGNESLWHTCKNDFGLVVGNSLYIVGPLAGKLAGSFTPFNS